MTPRQLTCLGAVMALGALVAACQRAPLSGPPALRLGRDECAECGMLLGEDRCAGALLVGRDGGRAHLVFDDIGCMLDYRAGHAEDQVVDAFVRDYAAREWLPASGAWYVLGGPNAPTTPMATGIVAFDTKDAAERQRATSGGSVCGLDEISDARRTAREARLGGR